MRNEVRYLMTQEQLKRYTVIQKSLEGLITVQEAAMALDLSARQVLRLRKHKNQGRKPARSIPDELKQKIISLKLSDTYKNANFKHFQELLERFEGTARGNLKWDF